MRGLEAVRLLAAVLLALFSTAAVEGRLVFEQFGVESCSVQNITLPLHE